MNRRDGAGWSESDDLDVWTVDRLLDGRLSASDIPAGYEEVGSLLAVIREGVAPAPSGWGSRTVPAMAQIITATPRRHVRRRRAAHARRLSHAAAAVGMFAVLGTGTAAAATGSLPAAVQSAVHSTAATIGVNLPAPERRGVHHEAPASNAGAPGGSGATRSAHRVGGTATPVSNPGTSGTAASGLPGATAGAAAPSSAGPTYGTVPDTVGAATPASPPADPSAVASNPGAPSPSTETPASTVPETPTTAPSATGTQSRGNGGVPPGLAGNSHANR